jgi:hypothetical protein
MKVIFFLLAMMPAICTAQAITTTKSYRVDSIPGAGLARFFVEKTTNTQSNGHVDIVERKTRFVNIDSADVFVTRFRATLVAQRASASAFVAAMNAQIDALDVMPQQRSIATPTKVDLPIQPAPPPAGKKKRKNKK